MFLDTYRALRKQVSPDHRRAPLYWRAIGYVLGHRVRAALRCRGGDEMVTPTWRTPAVPG